MERLDRIGRECRGGHALHNRLHNLVGRIRIDFGIEDHHAAEGRLGVGVARALVDLGQGHAAGLDGRPRRVAVFHDRTGRARHVFEYADRVVHVLDVGLGQAALAGLEDFVRAEDEVLAVGRPVKRGGLVGVGAIAQVFHLGIGAPQQLDGVREMTFRSRAVHLFEIFFRHASSS